MENIIINGRIVSDITFATRLRSFLSNIQVNDAMSEDELTYLKSVSEKLLLHQANTSKDRNEKMYLNRCHPNGI